MIELSVFYQFQLLDLASQQPEDKWNDKKHQSNDSLVNIDFSIICTYGISWSS